MSKVESAVLAIATCLLCGGAPRLAWSQAPWLQPSEWQALRAESSGAAPYENLRHLTTLHRVPATAAFDQAADFVLAQARGYGLLDARVERFPIDGERRYGLMRSYLGWQVKAATLWQASPSHALLADASTDPIRLADYSHSAEVEAPLVDVGVGTRESDYAGKDVRGKIVLADGVLSDVQALAVMKLGAAGIVSDMPNQNTAWSGQDPSLVRWGHLDARLPRGFAFMVSRAGAAALRADLAAGKPVLLRASVNATVGPGYWSVVSASIAGTDPAAGEIIYSCHLDHERPGANDNGSGCVTVLEAARILNTLISKGSIPRPLRGLRFVWGPEIEGTMAYLASHPDIRARLRADVHLDMVGGDPFKNKSILHVTATPWSLPSFIGDVGGMLAESMRDAATRYTESGEHADEAVIEERGVPGTRNTFLVDETEYAEGSDHDVYDSSTLAVPSIYLRDWPDIYIHTDHDALGVIDPTKLRRVALLSAASGYVLASLDDGRVDRALPHLAARAQQRMAAGFRRASELAGGGDEDAAFEASNYLAQLLAKETAVLQSMAGWTKARPAAIDAAVSALRAQAESMQRWLARDHGPSSPGVPAWRTAALAAKVPRRVGEFGPLTYQNDDVLRARLGEERVARIALFQDRGSRFANVQAGADLYAYEIMNFVDGRRTLADIRDAVSAEFGPIALDVVADYLEACVAARLIEYR